MDEGIKLVEKLTYLNQKNLEVYSRKIQESHAVFTLIRAVRSGDAIYAYRDFRMYEDDIAIPALISLLEQRCEDKDVLIQAISELSERKDTRAVIALIEALKDDDPRLWREAAKALGKILNACKTSEEIMEFEKMLVEGYAKLQKEARHVAKNMSEAEINIAKLKIAAADKKNSLAPKRDIILDDIPKPPKKGGVYQQMRRAIRNG